MVYFVYLHNKHRIKLKFMKRIIIVLVMMQSLLLFGQDKTRDVNVVIKKMFEKVENKDLEVIAKGETFNYKDYFDPIHEITLSLRTVKQEDSIAYMLFSIYDKSEYELPLMLRCEIVKKDSIAYAKEFNSELRLVHINKAIRNIVNDIKTKGINIGTKKTYIVILNNQYCNTYMLPTTIDPIADIIDRWKWIANRTKTGEGFIYCFGVYQNDKVWLDSFKCLKYPHDNLLKGKKTWNQED